jgi:hypothetical protein
MAQRRFHYEQAFEHFLRARQFPYIAVNEARKSLLPPELGHDAVKSFDFVVYTRKRKLIVDVKGRQLGSTAAKSAQTNRRMESWVTGDDLEGLSTWQRLFGEEYSAVFVFIYALLQQPPDALFERVFAYGGRWYVLREIALDTFRQHMVQRSSKWNTWHLPRTAYDQVSRSFLAEEEPACSAQGSPIC